MDLARLADFHAVATHGGFGLAARATGTSKATISRRVRALEDALGVRLIERGTRSLRLTDEGRTLQARTHALLDDLVEVGDEIAGRAVQVRGRLRVSLPGFYAQRFFGRFAASFVEAHPEVVLEATTDDRFVDPVADGADVVVRVNPAPDSRLVGHLLYADRFAVVAAPSLARPADGDPVPAIVLASRAEEFWRLEGPGGHALLRLRATLRFSSLVLIRDAVLAGAGVALLPPGLIAAELARGELVLWGYLADRRADVWVLSPSRRLQSAKVRAFVAMLRAFHAADHHAASQASADRASRRFEAPGGKAVEPGSGL